MAYQPDKNEVYFCGQCNRQQDPGRGIRCVVCGKKTVSWRLNKETSAEVLKRWKAMNG